MEVTSTSVVKPLPLGESSVEKLSYIARQRLGLRSENLVLNTENSELPWKEIKDTLFISLSRPHWLRSSFDGADSYLVTIDKTCICQVSVSCYFNIKA